MAIACTQAELETYHEDVDTILALVGVDDARDRLIEKFLNDPIFRSKAEENRAVFLPIMDRLPSTWVMTKFLRLCDEALTELQVRTV
ncbi:MAG TPA: hypothetical protein VE439_05455 [Anaerolineae bacterium]|jgi:hypothetical protein|nr:hypothetical protein [Anaerolineae bacterium]